MDFYSLELRNQGNSHHEILHLGHKHEFSFFHNRISLFGRYWLHDLIPQSAAQILGMVQIINFSSQLILAFLLLLVMVMYANEIETKEK